MSTDKIFAQQFHHIEFYCGDVTSSYKRFMYALGLELVSKSDFSTNNDVYNAYALQSGQLRILFSSPYPSDNISSVIPIEKLIDAQKQLPFPHYNPNDAMKFFQLHGLGVRAIGILVDNVQEAYSTMIANGAISSQPPYTIIDKYGLGWSEMAEIQLYGDVVLRLINKDNYEGIFLPNFQDLADVSKDNMNQRGRYGIERFDHIVGNVWSLPKTLEYMKSITVSIIIILLYIICSIYHFLMYYTLCYIILVLL